MTTLPTPAPAAMSPRPTAFDPLAATPEQRLAVGQLLADHYAFTYPDDPPLLPEREATGLTHLTPGEAAAHFVVWDGERALAYAHLHYDLKQNTHAAHAGITVHPEYRRRGLARALAAELERVARREGRHTITFGTTTRNPAGEAYARTLGAHNALPMRLSRLELAQLDPALLARWQTRPAGDPYRLHTWTVIPDEYLTRAADMMMVMNTAPRGDLDMQDWTITPEMIRAWEHMTREGGEVRTMMTVEDPRSGELVGLTETFWMPERAALVYQGATAVRPAARGQGLGKWLKAAMLRHVLTEFPGARRVQTGNAHENAAMLGINVALGFAPWADLSEWQLKLEGVEGGA